MLEETGLPYEPHRVSFDTNDQLSPEFRCCHPQRGLIVVTHAGWKPFTPVCHSRNA